RCFAGLAGFRAGGAAGLMTVMAAGFGSALATDLAVKDFSGTSPSIFLTSLRTFVSLMIRVVTGAQASSLAIRSRGLSNRDGCAPVRIRCLKSVDILLPCRDGHARSRLPS